jgi:hypothetical protein
VSGTDNLNRGNQRADGKAPELVVQPHGGALKVGGAGNPELWAKAREDEKELRTKVAEDPDAALEAIHVDLTVWTRALVRRGARTKGVPDSAIMNVIREFRQTQEAVTEARRAKGAVVEAAEFFGTLDDRVADLMRLKPEPEPAGAIE